MTNLPAPGARIPLAEHGRDQDERVLLARIESLERLLDRQFSVGGFRFGWDALVGLVPVVGDTLATGLSAWVVWQAHRVGAPGHLKARMLAHVGVDYLIGLVPLVGDIGDAVYKANTRNVRLLKRHLERRGEARAARGG